GVTGVQTCALPICSHAIVSATRDGDFVRVRVDDDGPGLPPGDPERLFDKFRRGDGEGSIAGVGLGLAICRAIIVAHGGDIRASQRSGRGARFAVTLPTTEVVS